MDWVHCNKCFLKLQPELKMYVVECSHIFCETCVKRVSDTNKCLVCEKSGSFIAIGNDMTSSVQPFFIPLEMQIKKLLEIYQFQMKHRERLCQAQMQKYQFAKKELITYHHKLKGVSSENKIMRNMLLSNSRGPNTGAFITSTPSAMTDDSPCKSVISSIIPLTPMQDKSKQSGHSMPGYAQRLNNNYDGNTGGMPPLRNQPVIIS
uniref:Probable E3 SUMO-protein ligase RNF212 n=1 Tax=Diabrotica virgifera virgifera TaxID=50390 RepID=A0A6P7G4C0_DIAVI